MLGISDTRQGETRQNESLHTSSIPQASHHEDDIEIRDANSLNQPANESNVNMPTNPAESIQRDGGGTTLLDELLRESGKKETKINIQDNHHTNEKRQDFDQRKNEENIKNIGITVKSKKQKMKTMQMLKKIKLKKRNETRKIKLNMKIKKRKKGKMEMKIKKI